MLILFLVMIDLSKTKTSVETSDKNILSVDILPCIRFPVNIISKRKNKNKYGRMIEYKDLARKDSRTLVSYEKSQ